MEKSTLLKLQLKRAMKIYPVILFVTFFTIVAIALTVSFVVMQRNNEEGRQRINVGIVGDMGETQLGIGVSLLQNLDTSRVLVNFIEMEESEAVNALKANKITGYVFIPEDFVRNVSKGKNVPAQYVMRDGSEGIGATISAEILNIVSHMVVEAQNGNNSLYEIAEKTGNKGSYKNHMKKLTLEYVSFILKRNDIYELNLVGVSDYLDLTGYFLCGIIFFFLLLWGISCNKLFADKNISMSRMLYSRGIKIEYQLLCEYLAFLMMTFITLQIFAVIVGSIAANRNLPILELNSATVASCVWFVVGMIPAIVMVTSMQMSFYEIFGTNVGGVIIQFLIAVGMGYISGCFYPNFFFPEAIQNFVNVLPTGAGFLYLRKLMSQTLSPKDFLLPVVYSAFFMFITFIARKRNMEVGK